jgi:hypothetical protein
MVARVRSVMLVERAASDQVFVIRSGRKAKNVRKK